MKDFYEVDMTLGGVAPACRLSALSNNAAVSRALYSADVVDWGYCGGEGDGTNLTWVLDNDGTLTISGEGAMTNTPWLNAYASQIQIVLIEDGVTSIGRDVFGSCTALTSVTIGNSVTTIHEAALDHCTSLTSVTMPDSVTIIGPNAFSYCSSLTSVTIGNGVTTIWECAFYECTSLAGVTIPDSVTILGASAFAHCTSLQNVTLPNGLTDTGIYGAFSYCSSLTSVEIPGSVTRISESTFTNCSSLKSVTIPDSVTTIERAAFSNCTLLNDVYYGGSEEQWNALVISDYNEPLQSATIHYYGVNWGYCGAAGNEEDVTWVLTNDGTLTISGTGAMANFEFGYPSYQRAPWESYKSQIQTLVIEDGVTSIGKQAFWGCKRLTSVTIPDSVTTIGDSAFHYCTSVESLTLGNSLTTIGEGAFLNCYKINSIEIPASVTSIGNLAFTGFQGQTYSVDPDNPAYCAGEDGCLYNKDKTTLIAYPVGKPDTTFDIPATVTTIAPSAFSSAMTTESSIYGEYPGHLESITVPATVTSIGDGALRNGLGVKYVKILNPDCAMSSRAYTYSIDGLYITTSFKLYGYIGSTAEASTHDEYLDLWYPQWEFFVALCPTDDTHTTVKADATDPTCTAPGHSAGWYCEDCGVWLSGEAINPLNHRNAQNVAATEATETAHGYTAGIFCPDCETWLSGHDVIHNHLGAQEVIQPPTEEEDGVVRIQCTVCGEWGEYTATWTEPEPDNGGSSGGFWQEITGFFRGIIDWFLRLFKWLG